ncbi:hypothetical protein MYX75_05630 [Acidobacteria bacterium AH-259-A15]|nr:hypothetical protein [Acidobacteria bacterium AH-259-A15]
MPLRIVEEERQKDRGRPAATLRAEGLADDLFVVRRRRCPRIDSSSLRNLASPDPQQTLPYL